jgi:hypothetical protein
MAMKETLDELYRRTATQRPSSAVDNAILNAANVQAKRWRTYRQWRQVGFASSAALALWILISSSHHADSTRDKVREHYAALTRAYLLAAKLQTTISEEAALDRSRSDAP